MLRRIRPIEEAGAATKKVRDHKQPELVNHIGTETRPSELGTGKNGDAASGLDWTRCVSTAHERRARARS